MTREWRELQPSEVAAWNESVYDAGGRLWQLPFWTTFIARSGMRTAARTVPVRRFRYFVDEDGGTPRTWACVMEVGLPGYRVALVQDGPVGMTGPVDEQAVRGLCALLRSYGYVFVRFSNTPSDLAVATSVDRAVPDDLFPFFQKAGRELHIPLSGDEAANLARLPQNVRYKIRRAARDGYQIVTGEDVLDQVHELLVTTAVRKGFRVPPPLSSFAALSRDAAPVDGIRLYLARGAGGVPVGAAVVGTERHAWHYLWGGADADSLRGRGPSPNILLQWTAMRDAAGHGATFYNLGAPAPPSVERFKRQFRPVDVDPQPAITVALRPVATAAWRRIALPTYQRARPAVRHIRRGFQQRTHPRPEPSGAGTEEAVAGAGS